MSSFKNSPIFFCSMLLSEQISMSKLKIIKRNFCPFEILWKIIYFGIYNEEQSSRKINGIANSFCTSLCNTIMNLTQQYCNKPQSAILHSASLCNTAQRLTLQYCTAPHCNIAQSLTGPLLPSVYSYQTQGKMMPLWGNILR